MKRFAPRATAIVAVSFLLATPAANAESNSSSILGEAEEFQWAHGRTIDSVYVVGATKTQPFAILREMESRVGMRLEPLAVARDQRYLTDLSMFAKVVITVEPRGVDRCALRVDVTERPTLLVKLVYPILEYDFNRDRLRYGAKWTDRNFRNRLESFTLDATRNSVNDDNAAISWSSSWIGWRHIGVGGRVSYFHRNDTPSSLGVLEQSRFAVGVSLPLTDSRISFAQVIANLSFARDRMGSTRDPSETEHIVSPLVGFRFDRRDSRIRPTTGEFFFVSWQTSRVVSGEGSTYYRLVNDTRLFRSLNEFTVLGLYSNVSYQVGSFPEHIRFGLGGPGTLRGYSDGEFRGSHRWIQTAEVRIAPMPQWFIKLPFAGLVDVTAAVVLFTDGGIVWDGESTFGSGRYRGGFGWGLRIYSPLQDVVRFDIGYNRRGNLHPYFSTGIRF
jgi:outer membrane protein assembly factor BamA